MDATNKLTIPTPEELESLKEVEGGIGGDKCWLAMKAAWDTLAEYCGDAGISMEMEGMSLSVPVDVISMARMHPDMSYDERIQMIAATEWCVNTATEMCEALFGEERGTTTHLNCIDGVAKRIAAKVIG